MTKIVCRALFAITVFPFANLIVFGESALEQTYPHVHFSVRSAGDGNWSDEQTWQPARVPGAGDRVLITRGTRVRYDSRNKDVIRLVQVVGTPEFARDCDTQLHVGLLKVQNSETCSLSGFESLSLQSQPAYDN